MKISGHIVDILNERIFDGTIVVKGSRIENIVEEAVSLTPAPYILPGFIDSHIHIESTLLLPENFARLAVRQGTVAVVSDPHEIANVLGVPGVDYMIRNGRKVRFHFNFGVPSGVPATPFETAGAKLGPAEVEELLSRDDVYGLAELMNAFGVVGNDPEVMAKIAAAKKYGKPIDGHAPGFRGDQARKYIDAGVSTDHECTTLAEAEERIKLGMKILIREGSAACDFEELSPLLSRYRDQLMFCTDDKYADELQKGHINKLVGRAVKKGHPLWNILRAACVNPVLHYRLRSGLLRKGDSADFILIDNFIDCTVEQTWIEGRKVWDLYDTPCDIERRKTTSTAALGKYPNKFFAQPVAEADIAVPEQTSSDKTTRPIKVLQASEGSLYTKCLQVRPKTVGGHIVPDTDRDILKLVVCNRYAPAQPQVAFINGFGLKRGALASTIAHDSHNIIAVGCSDAEIVRAINCLVQNKGGIAVCDGEKVFDLPLPIAGLMSPLTGEEVGDRHRKLKSKAKAVGCRFAAPYMTLAFMALPVIPEIKLTDKGLFDANTFSFTDLFV